MVEAKSLTEIIQGECVGGGDKRTRERREGLPFKRRETGELKRCEGIVRKQEADKPRTNCTEEVK